MYQCSSEMLLSSQINSYRIFTDMLFYLFILIVFTAIIATVLKPRELLGYLHAGCCCGLLSTPKGAVIMNSSERERFPCYLAILKRAKIGFKNWLFHFLNTLLVCPVCPVRQNKSYSCQGASRCLRKSPRARGEVKGSKKEEREVRKSVSDVIAGGSKITAMFVGYLAY